MDKKASILYTLAVAGLLKEAFGGASEAPPPGWKNPNASSNDYDILDNKIMPAKPTATEAPPAGYRPPKMPDTDIAPHTPAPAPTVRRPQMPRPMSPTLAVR